MHRGLRTVREAVSGMVLGLRAETKGAESLGTCHVPRKAKASSAY